MAENRCPSCLALIPEGESECPKCKDANSKEKEKIKRVQTPTVVTEKFLAEEIWDRKGSPKFLVYWLDDEKFEELGEIDLGETDDKGRKVMYVPVFNEMLRKGLVIVPTGVTPCDFNEVLEKIDAFTGLPNYDACGKETVVRFLSRVAICSWFLDRFVEDPLMDVAGAGKFAPIIPIRGPSQSGKNRLAFLLRMFSYRPYFEMSTYRVPSLYRPLDVWKGTLILDEADFAGTTEKSELIHFLNCRATGTPISRQDSKNPKITHTFSNFGQTILTQRRIFDDNATESRCLPYYSEATDRQLPTVETDEMLKRGLELQNLLLYLRMKYYKKIVIDKTAWVNGVSDPRLVASLLPLLALGKFEPEIKNIANGTIQEVERLKIEQKANSEDGTIINHLWEKIGEGSFALWNNPHFYVLTKEKTGEGEDDWIPVPLTTTRMSDELKWTTRTVRKVVNSLSLCAKGLPSTIKVGNKTWRVIFFDPEKMEKRLREFVVGYEPKKILKLAGEKLGVGQQKLPTEEKVTEVTQDTDIIHGDNLEETKEAEVPEDTPYARSVTSVSSVTEGRHIGLRADSCEFWRTTKCTAGVPSAVFPDTPCPETCKNYVRKAE